MTRAVGPAGAPRPSGAPPRSSGAAWTMAGLGVFLGVLSLGLLLLGVLLLGMGVAWNESGAIAGGAAVAFVGIVMGICAVVSFSSAGDSSEARDLAQRPAAPRPRPPKHRMAWFVFDLALLIVVIAVLGWSAVS